MRKTLRQPFQLFPIVFFPVILLAVNASGLKSATKLVGFPTDSYVSFAIAVAFLQGAMFALINTGTNLAEDIESGFFNRLALTPLRRVSLIAGLLVGVAAIGGALSAEKLVLCTGAPGILERADDGSSVVSYTDIKGLKRLREQGALRDGMLPKAAAIEHAIRAGVRRVHVISYKSADSLLAEIFTKEGTGTLVVEDLTALSAAEQLSTP